VNPQSRRERGGGEVRPGWRVNGSDPFAEPDEKPMLPNPTDAVAQPLRSTHRWGYILRRNF
jgi:hypothetical protein